MTIRPDSIQLMPIRAVKARRVQRTIVTPRARERQPLRSSLLPSPPPSIVINPLPYRRPYNSQEVHPCSLSERCLCSLVGRRGLVKNPTKFLIYVSPICYFRFQHLVMDSGFVDVPLPMDKISLSSVQESTGRIGIPERFLLIYNLPCNFDVVAGISL